MNVLKLVKLARTTLAENDSENKYSSCTVYIVLMIVFFTIFTGITIYLVYYNWLNLIKFGIRKETKIS